MFPCWAFKKKLDCIPVRKSHLRRLTVRLILLWFHYFDWVAHVCVSLQSSSPSLIFNHGNVHPSLQRFPFFPPCLHFTSRFLVLGVLWPFSSLTFFLLLFILFFSFPLMSRMFVTILCVTILPLKNFNHLCCSLLTNKREGFTAFFPLQNLIRDDKLPFCKLCKY